LTAVVICQSLNDSSIVVEEALIVIELILKMPTHSSHFRFEVGILFCESL
jgi:hypothetical protein